MASITVEVNDAEVRQRLDQLMGVLRGSGDLMQRIAGTLHAQTMQAFQEQGPGWEKLKPATANATIRKGVRRGDKNILQVDRYLRGNISSDAGADYAVIGTNVVYAAIHQFGGTINRAPYEGKLRLRTDAKGNLLRQGKEGKASRLAVFARGAESRLGAEHKRYTERAYKVHAYQIHIPARPFFPITPDGKLKPTALEAVMDVLQRALQG